MNRAKLLTRSTAEVLAQYDGLKAMTEAHPEGQDTVKGCDWRQLAACKEEDPELFFPIGTSGPALLQIEQAKAVCFRCPAATDCLAWALDTGQDSGVWGGLSEDERRALKRRMGW